MKIQELNHLITEWACDKGLVKHTQEQALAQHSKTEEKVKAFLEAIAAFKSKAEELEVSAHTLVVYAHQKRHFKSSERFALEDIKLKAGDVLVTLIIHCAIAQISIYQAIQYCEFNPGDFVFPTYLRFIREDLEMGYLARPQQIGGIYMEVESAIEAYGLTPRECLWAAWNEMHQAKRSVVAGL